MCIRARTAHSGEKTRPNFFLHSRKKTPLRRRRARNWTNRPQPICFPHPHNRVRKGLQPKKVTRRGRELLATASRKSRATRFTHRASPEQRVDRLRVRLAARGLHHLTDKPADDRGLCLRLLGLVGIGRNDLIDRSFDCAGVRDLLEPARLDDRARIAALVPCDLEQILGDLAGDRSLGNEIETCCRAAQR